MGWWEENAICRFLLNPIYQWRSLPLRFLCPFLVSNICLRWECSNLGDCQATGHLFFTLFTHSGWWSSDHYLLGWIRGHALTSQSPGAARRCWQVCLQHWGRNIIFTNFKKFCICFCSTLAPLAIKKHPSNCTDSWILFLSHIYKYLGFLSNFLFRLLLLLFIIYYLFLIAHYSPLHLWCSFF